MRYRREAFRGAGSKRNSRVSVPIIARRPPLNATNFFPQPPRMTPKEIRRILLGVLLTMFLAALDQTIVAPALPTIARDLHEFDSVSWVVTAYLLSATVTTPILGKLSDLYGRKRLMLG